METRSLFVGALSFGLIIMAIVAGSVALERSYNANEVGFGPETDSLTVDIDGTNQLKVDESVTRFHDNESLTNSTGEPLTEGIDYEFNLSNGELTWYEASPDLSDGETVTATFHYRGHPATAGQLFAMQPTLIDLLTFIALALLGIVGVAGLGFAIWRELGNSRLATSGSRRRY